MDWEEILQLNHITSRELAIFKQLPRDEFYHDEWYVEEYRHTTYIIKNKVNVEIEQLNGIVKERELEFSLRWPKKDPQKYKFSWKPGSKNKFICYEPFKQKIIKDIFDSMGLSISP